jgi:hypothetical protein
MFSRPPFELQNQLYLDGKIEQFWFRADTGPIFLMAADSVEEAKTTIDATGSRRLCEISILAGRPTRAAGPVAPGQVGDGGAPTQGRRPPVLQ